MKKILSIALIAALVATSAFAATISGNASVGFNYDIDAKTYGLANNGLMNKVEFTYADEFFNETVEKKGEGEIYAGIKASLVIDYSEKITFTKIDGNEAVWTDAFSAAGYKKTGTLADYLGGDWAFTAKIDEAYITNGEWKLNILGSKAASDYAQSAIDTYKVSGKTKYVSAVAPSLTANDGVVFTMDGYLASFGLSEGDENGANMNAMVETKTFEVADGVTVQGAVEASSEKATKTTKVGASAKAAYTSEAVDATVAADALVEKVDTADATFNADVAVKAVVKEVGVTVDAYYAMDATAVTAYTYAAKNLLSAQAAYKTTIEDVAVTFTATGLDLINSQDLTAKAAATIDNISGSVYGGYVVATEAWKAGAACTYTAEKFVADGAIDLEANSLKLSAGIKSTTIVDGATLEAKYASGNLLADTAVIGTVSATATIAF